MDYMLCFVRSTRFIASKAPLIKSIIFMPNAPIIDIIDHILITQRNCLCYVFLYIVILMIDCVVGYGLSDGNYFYENLVHYSSHCIAIYIVYVLLWCLRLSLSHKFMVS